MRTHRLLLCCVFAALLVLLTHELFSQYYHRGPQSVYRKWVNLMKIHVVNNHFIQESEDKDLQVRMKFQQAQMKQYCASVSDAVKWPHKPTHKENILKYFFTNNSSTIFMCYVQSKGLDYMNTVREMELYNATCCHPSDTFKFTIVQHPLEKLLFAYINHLHDPLYYSSNQFPNNLKQEIFEMSRPVVYHHWISTGGVYNISITFSEFINYYIESFKDLLDSRLQPYTQVCQPCQVMYHFYGRYRRLEAELSEVAKYVGLEDIKWQEQSEASSNVTDLLLDYYGKLTSTEKSRLYDVLRQELLFYYYLYPGERFSHVTLLGIHDDLYTSNR